MLKNLNKTSLKIFAAAVIMILCSGLLAFANEGGHVEIGKTLPLWSVIPFVGMLLSIAIFPLVKGEWWEHNMLKVAIFWALVFLVPFGIAYGGHVLTFYVLETSLQTRHSKQILGHPILAKMDNSHL